MTDDSDQSEVLDFLSRLPGGAGTRAIRIDTHAASVFLAGERAYKIKRAVRFSFLDYSTLEKRRQACTAELAINSAFAPDIYLDVVPVTRGADGALRLGGDGAALEWVLRMRRFDETRTLDRLVPAGAFDDAAGLALAETVAKMHAAAKPADAEVWFAALARAATQNIAALRRYPALFEAAPVAALGGRWQAMIAGTAPLLRARAARGLVRRCHGDLHLANIAMIDGLPQPFDAIEFDETIASGDLLYDLAFLLMDLIGCGASGAATLILNRYLVETNGLANHDGLAALPLFMSLRAAIRAQVTAAKLARPGAAPETAEAARAYCALAHRLADPPPPMLVAVGGLSGTGKSVLARALAPFVKPEPGAVHLRSDVERKRLAGVPETTALPPSHYTREESARLYDHLRRKAAAILDARHSVVVDAVHATAEERAAIKAIADERKIAFHGLFLTTRLDVRTARVGRRTGDASDATAEVARRQEGYDLGVLEWTPVDASGTPEETLARAIAALRPAASSV